MIKPTLFSVALLATCSLSGTVLAQNSQNMPMHQQMMQHSTMPKQHQMIRHPDLKAPDTIQQPFFIDFPTADELARMTPPEPMTEEKIKKHFTKHKARVEEAVSRDRKQAEKYAKDFARFQKHQADQLAKIMAKAEKQREVMLQRVSKHEKLVLENFRKRNTTQNTEPKQ